MKTSKTKNFFYMKGKKVKMKKLLAVLLSAVIVFSMTACSGTTDNQSSSSSQNSSSSAPSEALSMSDTMPVTVTDQLGREVTIEKEPEKIVSGYYISTSLLIALGQQDKLVGIEAKADSRPIYSLAAKELLELPDVGTAKEFNLEGCAALSPDLVILPAKLKDSIPALEELGITVIAVNPEDEKLLDEAIDLLGKVTGSSEKAEELKAFNEKLLSDIDTALSDVEKQTVYLSSNSSFLAAAGADMYQNTLIENAGGTNVAAELEGNSWADVSYEQILAWNPQVIVIASDADYTVDDVLADTNIAEVDAVKNKKVYQLPDDFESWDSPVPSGVLGTAWLANALYPEKYSADDLKNTVTEFYETFYGFTPDVSSIA